MAFFKFIMKDGKIIGTDIDGEIEKLDDEISYLWNRVFLKSKCSIEAFTKFHVMAIGLFADSFRWDPINTIDKIEQTMAEQETGKDNLLAWSEKVTGEDLRKIIEKAASEYDKKFLFPTHDVGETSRVM